MYIAFAEDGDKIHLPTTEVLLHAAAGDLMRSKNQQDWTPHNAFLLPPFLTEAAILNGESDMDNSWWFLLAPSRSGQRKGKTLTGTTTKTTTKATAVWRRQQRKSKQSRPPLRRWPLSKTISTTSCPSSMPSQSSHRGATLSLSGQARARLVLSMDGHQPHHTTQAGPKISHGYHGRLDRRGDQAKNWGSTPPRRSLPAWGRKGDQGMVPSPTNGSACHTGSKRYQRNLLSDLSTSHHPPPPKHKERDGPPSRLFPELCRGKSLPT